MALIIKKRRYFPTLLHSLVSLTLSLFYCELRSPRSTDQQWYGKKFNGWNRNRQNRMGEKRMEIEPIFVEVLMIYEFIVKFLLWFGNERENVDNSIMFWVSSMELHILLVHWDWKNNASQTAVFPCERTPEAENFCRQFSAATSVFFVVAEKMELD